ncbi:hypothetical protein DAPPUDRAFT_105030 [Daphnia pulex]|uniref:Endonuclease/exonuclease/phosphatase domain-containing protein n=1 Tax=Daphnia pulex TaxID=6669 RepID=E9GP62_DAPPU|nr:hypothetical protein DAPPUDRAFT_105030 [Daphnia pulex]|eukprot:EFX78733.1 hypothetical protein DAPPUDRAFT_105030 [Daphnia pulex]
MTTGGGVALLFRSTIRVGVLLPGRLLIVGDFNIHVDNLADSTAIKFLSIVESHGLFQHLSKSTHIRGHIIEVWLTRVSDNLFREDLILIPLISNSSDNIDEIVEQYNTSLAHVLKKHAPLIKEIVAVRSDNPWLTDEMRLWQGEKLGNWKEDKISDIRASMDAEGPLATPEEPRLANMFSRFSQVSVSEVASLLDKCPSKPSLRDPISTFLLKEFSDILVHPITNIIN